MAVGIPAKRRKLGDDAEPSPASVTASLGRHVRVYRTALASRKPASPASTQPTSLWAVIRVVFPDRYVLEAAFGRWEAVERLVDLLRRAVSRPEKPFYIYTAPPKERVSDLTVDFFSAGFVPGAVVYFGGDGDDGGDEGWPFYLREEVCSMEEGE